MIETDPDKLFTKQKVDDWLKKRKKYYTGVSITTGITIGFIIGIEIGSPSFPISLTISFLAIVLTVDFALISLATSWSSSEWNRVSSLINENNFNDMRALLRHIIRVVDPEAYSEYLKLKATLDTQKSESGNKSEDKQ